MRLALTLLGLLTASAFAVGGACSRGDANELRVIDGAGATFPYPLYSRWSQEFASVEPMVRINYQSVGSGAGIRQISDGVADFGATDEPMSDVQLERAGDIAHVPMTIGAVVITYNLPAAPGEPLRGSGATLRLTPDLVADVFRGTVTRWDDDRIRAANPEAVLANEPIVVVHRADGSGTSATFTSYLSHNSEAWRADVGAGTSPRFPVGVGVRGNEGVSAFVKATPFAFGYVELAHARQAGLPVALVKNRAGRFVAPTRASLESAARSALPRLPDDLRITIVDSSAEDAYPIAALSFFVIRRDSRDRRKAEALSQFVWWALHEGQRFAPELSYAPLPPELVARTEPLVRRILADGTMIAFPRPEKGN